MKLLVALLPFSMLLAAPAARAQSDVFVCVDEQGRKTYQNTGVNRGCKRLDSQPLVSVPAPRLPPAGGARASQEQRAAPANFPRVDNDTQRARDNDRRRILDDELRAEEDKLTRLRAEFNAGQPERKGDERNFARYQERVARLQEEIQRSESNVASLQRELALTRQ